MGRILVRLAPAFIAPLALWGLLGTMRVETSAPAAPAPIIISEVAWGGTAANSADEWLELYNSGNTAIDLSGWQLSDGDGGLDIQLSGVIGAGGFYLLERTDDSTISDVPADQIYTGSLINDGETLALLDDNGEVVSTANQDGGPWPAGSAAPNYASMENLDPLGGDVDTNWVNNNQVIRNGQDADGNPINGTPGQPNAAWSYDGNRNVVIEAVYFDGYETLDADEAVQIRNLGPDSVDLAGWTLSDGSSEALLPAGNVLSAGNALWLAADADAFRRQFGFPADIELGSDWPGFANSGDEVILTDAVGVIADVLVYKDGSATQAGWLGPSLRPYLSGAVFAEEGQVLYRAREQRSGALLPDTDTGEDWAQTTADVFNGRRVRYPGWELERFFYTARVTETAVLTVAVAPDNAFHAVLRQIESARVSLQIETLTLENVALGEALADAAARGVSVTVLLEGGPAGGLSDQERYICGRIEGVGGACWFMIADAGARIADRYRNLHAKFMLVDNVRVLIGSENLSPNSLPDDDKSDGTWGRRGAILITNAPGVVSRVAEIFAADFAPATHRDLFRWNAAHAVYGAPPPGFVPITITGGVTYSVRFPDPIGFTGHFPFEVVQAPENALRTIDGMLGLVNRAGPGDTLLVQQLQERPYWGSVGSTPATDPNPRLEAYISAARRGARVRLLLDAFFPVDNALLANPATCAYVNDIARRERLDLACAPANPTGLGIHNKMILAELAGQGWVHVGSLNGTELSAKGNRELALQVQSNEAFEFLARMFEQDWPYVNYLPLALREPGRARHVVISEVVYDPPGLDDAEFIEIANPTSFLVDISFWSLGDAVNPEDFEDVRIFPAGTLLSPDSVLVVAATASGFQAVFGSLPDFEIVDSDPAIPDMTDDPAWGDPAALLQLGNQGDEILLRDPIGVVVDVLTYGIGAYPGHIGCMLLTPPNQSLERFPFWLDSDNCPNDFRGWPFPSPGALPGE